MMQVHKETIDAIPNALSSRCDPEIEIYGMKGIPVEDMMRHQREAHAKTVSFIEYWDGKSKERLRLDPSLGENWVKGTTW